MYRTIALLSAIFAWSVFFSGTASESCNARKDITAGFTYKKEKFTADGKPFGYYVVTVDSLHTKGDSLISYFTSKGIGSSGKPVSMNGSYICSGNSILMDPLSLMDEAGQSGHVTVHKSSPIIYPNRLQTGDTLIPWELYLTFTESWGGQMTFRINCTKRRCTGRDTLTIGSRQYDTWLVESASSTVMKQGVVTMGRMELRAEEWVSPVYGVLRTNVYSDKGLVNYSLVTSITE
jgi:hypothetical protein